MLSATDLQIYGSAVMPEDDVTTNVGGAIDETTLVSFTPLDVTGPIEMVSDNAGDTTQTITVTGRAADGRILTDTKSLNGTTVVDLAGSFKRLLKAELSAPAAGIVTLRKNGAGGDLMIFPAGITTIRRPFYNAAADVAGGVVREYHDKGFYKNTSATDALLMAQVMLEADPSGNVTFGLENALNGTGDNGANGRLTAPVGIIFDAGAKSVPGGDLPPGAAIGMWLKLTLAAGEAANAGSFTPKITGRGAA